MSLDAKKKSSRIRYLKERRAQLQENLELKQKRDADGVKVLHIINQVFESRYQMTNFRFDYFPSNHFSWSDDPNAKSVSIRTCPGHNSGYINKQCAQSIVECIEAVLVNSNGVMEFDTHKFMGHLRLDGTVLSRLVGLAEKLNDSIYFYPDQISCVLMVGCEVDLSADNSLDFSVIAQGDCGSLLAKCFS